MITMVLFVAASLIGMSSIYQPANVETQPQPLIKQPSKQFPGAGQALSDTLFLDRMMPKIIQRIDGATLLQKIDARTLAKILPYLDLKVSTIVRNGQTYDVKGAGTKIISLLAQCAPGETIVSGGYITYTSDGEVDSFKKIINPENTWEVGATASDGQFISYATCLKVALGLQGADQQP